MNISEHISFTEATASQTAVRKGIDNTPDEPTLLCMKNTAENIFEPLRKLISEKRGVDSPITISSFFRCPDLNKAIGGATNSQHCLGQAMDLEVNYPDFKKHDLFKMVMDNLPFDQIIAEGRVGSEPAWIHVSYGPRNRKEVLLAIFTNGIARYVPYTEQAWKDAYGD
jgi:uncharacterized protein YcbK (DUF882 family)